MVRDEGMAEAQVPGTARGRDEENRPVFEEERFHLAEDAGFHITLTPDS
jgi:hypothetical protein